MKSSNNERSFSVVRCNKASVSERSQERIQIRGNCSYVLVKVSLWTLLDERVSILSTVSICVTGCRGPGSISRVS